VEINNYVVEGLVDTGASMSVMAVAMIREIGNNAFGCRI
jgi:predicted aspartyl protease